MNIQKGGAINNIRKQKIDRIYELNTQHSKLESKLNDYISTIKTIIEQLKMTYNELSNSEKELILKIINPDLINVINYYNTYKINYNEKSYDILSDTVLEKLISVLQLLDSYDKNKEYLNQINIIKEKIKKIKEEIKKIKEEINNL